MSPGYSHGCSKAWGGYGRRGGFHTSVRGTMFVRNGAVTPGPSHKCDITFVKRRPKSAQQPRESAMAARRAQSVTVPSCQQIWNVVPRVKVPLFKIAQYSLKIRELPFLYREPRGWRGLGVPKKLFRSLGTNQAQTQIFADFH